MKTLDNEIISDANGKLTISINTTQEYINIWFNDGIIATVLLKSGMVKIWTVCVFIGDLTFSKKDLSIEQLKYLERFK